MSGNQRQYRPRQIVRPWASPGYQDADLIIQQINDEIRRLESTKVATLTHWTITEDTNGDLIIESTTGPTVRLRATSAGVLSISGDAHVSGAANIGGALGVSGAANISGAASVTGNLSVGGTITASGATTLKGTLEASGAATFDAAATVNGNLSVSGTAEVSGAVTADGAATVKGNLAVSGTAEVSGTTTLDGDLAHKGSHVGFFGATPQARPSAYTVTNSTPIRSIDVSTVTLTQLANFVASMIADFKSRGDFQ